MVNQKQNNIIKQKKKLKEKAQNCYRNPSEKERDKKVKMEEVDTKICLKKINKN